MANLIVDLLKVSLKKKKFKCLFIDLASYHMCTVALKNESPMYRRENSITFFTGILKLIQLLN